MSDSLVAGLSSSSVSSPLTLTNSYLPTKYELTLDIDYQKPNFKGSLDIDLEKSNDSDKFELTLHSNKLVITRASVDGISLKISYNRSQQQVTFSSEEPIEMTFNKKIQLEYMGQINTIKTYQDKTYGFFKTNYSDSITGNANNFILATHCQPTGCRLIFPCIDELYCKCPIKLNIVTLSKFKVISNEILDKEEIISLSDKSKFIFKETPKISTSIFGFVIGDLDFIESNNIKVFTTKGDSHLGQYTLDTIAKLLPIMNQVFGIEYPLSKLDFIGLPFLSDMAMENWGMVNIISQQLLVDPNTANQDVKRQLRQLIAHEMIHQWIGNWITFDDWKWLWLNESFATFLGDYFLYLANIDEDDSKYFELNQIEFIEKLMDDDCFINENGDSIKNLNKYMNELDINLNSSTNSIFDKNSYEKGMILLRMIASIIQYDDPTNNNHLNYNKFIQEIGKFITQNKEGVFKPFDLWNSINDSVSIDLPSFIHSWINYAGYPILNVKSVDKSVEIEQHRFIYGSSPTILNLEDQPFHLPLFIKYENEKKEIKILNVLLTDRKTTIDIPINQILTFNHNKLGYYKTIYDDSFHPDLSKLNDQEIISLINDYGKVLGQSNISNHQELIKLIQILENLLQLPISFPVWKVSLNYLEIINHIFIHFTDYTKFEKWLLEYIDKVYEKFGDWDQIVEMNKTDYNSIEFDVRNQILQIGYTSPKFQKFAIKIYKNFTNGKKFIPKELLLSVFNLTICCSGQKEYKQILSLVKNSNVSNLKVTNSSIENLQTIAISSLSFTSNKDLLTKSMNFVMTNIDSKLIELCLVGFKYKHNQNDKLLLWNWYKVNYDQFILKSLRKGSDWAKQIGITMSNISKLVLGEIMQFDQDVIEKFVNEKTSSLPNHNLNEIMQEVNMVNEEKYEIAKHYDQLVKYLN
ncbi:hypothetical protein HYPBUDRAFT_8532 [Hyphopichia burtonii NRRL Y-1933]|uniref:Aminopeptidase n=1 Tax=Hyphopichia burtonii NRRL Y-1933 TaxID=984485 RepID=A0A1E4RBR9_9ASCO|nr:hypothetical protein HYPBUDRAFT_8532 [Hyphopichia burtonii NRRL Y-1933]ODV64673.1 hypothetical protein HYPBUDRAFT_8532 [Hyphopichia burtonii NRRL Y-1933]